MKTRVAVIGGGPAGAAAALALAQRGVSVAVVEPGFKPKAGECLFPAANALLARVGLVDPASEGHRASPGIRIAWGGPVAERDFIAHPGGVGWNLDRAKFEAGLRARAIAAGAAWIDRRLATVAPGPAPFRLAIEGAPETATITADAVIDASGRAAAFARRRGIGRIARGKLVALHRRCPGAVADPRLLVERVGEGWWYSAGLADGLVVSFQTAGKASTAPALGPETAARIATLPIAGRTLAEPRRFAAGASRLAAIAGEGWLAIGDAAFAHDPLSGHGIAAALASGLDGAAAIADWLAGARDALAAHERARLKAWAVYREGVAMHYAA
jgi:flavin-dependent dehydrogenase